MTISTIIVNFNALGFTREAISSLLKFTEPHEIIVVDNGSIDENVDLLRSEFPTVKTIRLQTNIGFGGANNAGASLARGDILFFLNNDAYVEQDVIQRLSRHFEKDLRVGACGPKLRNPDGSFQFSTGIDPSLIGEWKTRRQNQNKAGAVYSDSGLIPLSKLSEPVVVDWVTGAALMVRKDVFEMLGGFDDQYFMYFEDADLCRRIRLQGMRILYDPTTELFHHRGVTRVTRIGVTSLEYRKSQLHYYEKFNGQISILFLRTYLFFKFGLQWLRSVAWPTRTEERSFAASIIRLLF